MKTIVSLICVLAVSVLSHAQAFKVFEPYHAGEVRSTLLDNALAQGGLDKYEEEKQKFFLKEMREALEKVSIPDSMVTVRFYENEAAANAIQARLIPKDGFIGVNMYLIDIKRSDLLSCSETVLSHIAYYILCGIKNADGPEVDDNERCRRAEVAVYNTVGWERFKEFVLATYGWSSGPADEFLQKKCAEIGVPNKDSKVEKPLEVK